MKLGAPDSNPEDAAEAERIAVRALARRGFSRAELRERLQRRGVATAMIEPLLDRCVERGWIDEHQLAVDHALAGIAKGRGRDRVLRELGARGLGAVAEPAWDAAVAERGGDPRELLRAEARRHVARCGGSLPPRAYRRVYNALLRAGHDAEVVRAELDPHREFLDPSVAVEGSPEFDEA